MQWRGLLIGIDDKCLHLYSFESFEPKMWLYYLMQMLVVMLVPAAPVIGCKDMADALVIVHFSTLKGALP